MMVVKLLIVLKLLLLLLKLYMQDGKEVIVEKAGKVKQYCSEVGTGLKLYAQDAIKKVTPILSVIPHWRWW